MGWKPLVLAGVAVVAIQGPEMQEPVRMFSDAERKAVKAYWTRPGTVTYAAPGEAALNGLWRINLTVDGSKWLWNFNRLISPGKLPPSQDPKAQNEKQAVWETWIQNKVAYDRYLAAVEAEKRNLLAGSSATKLTSEPAPVEPGPQPPELLEKLGAAPSFAEPVKPVQATVAFPDGRKIVLTNNPPMRARYAYYRFAQGYMSGGTSVRSMPREQLEGLFKDAGMTPKVQRVMKAVSMLEGGFDSINTYDTGYVSVGLIQFACLSGGAGSLGSMLKLYKMENPEGFQKDFRFYGIDVTPDGLLAVVDPVDGNEYQGPAAAQKIIDHVGLIATFQRAGQASRGYCLAQIRAAKNMFYPEDDVVPFMVGEQAFQARVGDIIKTEAGMATLMDRKVNTGKLDPFPQVLAQAMVDYELKSVEELAEVEMDIVAQMKYRRDYLLMADLGQPNQPSRHKKSRGNRDTQPPPSRKKNGRR